MESFSGSLRRLRKGLRMSQAIFSQSLGISQGYLSDLERGNKHPSDTLLIALTSRYGALPGVEVDGALAAGPVGGIPLYKALNAESKQGQVSGEMSGQVCLPEMSGATFAMVATGNFMAPTIVDGDLLLLAPVTESELEPGTIVLLNNQWGEVILRRYRLRDDQVMFSPDNNSYKPFIPDAGTTVLAKVAKIWRQM